ncbi:MAG: FKBP-type peptidyl-prolyl cis-trans isomerase [Lentisphaerae bacterium]|nr:FKBP-type peptidyl-prolyl cis-trans isomerase [Lentisphaerota bacterium]
MILAIVAVASVLTPAYGSSAKGSKASPQTDKGKLSYALGHEIGVAYLRLGTEIDLDTFLRGVSDSVKRAKPTVSLSEMNRVKQAFMKKIQERRAKQMQQMQAQSKNDKALAEKNLKDNAAFLAANKKKPGVVTTKSGLQYIVMRQGKGPKPKASDVVSVHYHGTVLDGTVFDSSVQTKQPYTTPVTRVVPGWIEGLQLMNVGSKYKLFLPGKLAYGPRRRGPKIGPNQLLVFEVELLSIQKKSSGPAGSGAKGR